VQEQELVEEHDLQGGSWHRILRVVLDQDQRDWYPSQLSVLCARLGIDFVDLNKTTEGDEQWFFVDRVHLNDAGQNRVAEIMASRLHR
jgi:lysophospholipase L1-like esterase